MNRIADAEIADRIKYLEAENDYLKKLYSLIQARGRTSKNLSPVIDFHTGEILSYDVSENVDYAQIRCMLQSLVANHGSHLHGAILHSAQGWQYQMPHYQAFLREHGILQSMSRKGNCLDNAPTENLFGRLKTELYYDKEFSYYSLQHLKLAISEYIEYYNNQRIVSRLQCSPIQYKNKINTASSNI